MSDGILYWLSFPFSKQEATKSTGLSPAVNLSGLQPGLSRQSLLNGQKSFPGSRADLVLFRSFISQFMPNLCANERGSKPSLLCSLACLNTFLWSSSFVFSLNILHSTLIHVHGQERNKVRKWFELLVVISSPPRCRLDPACQPPWSPQRCHWLLLFQCSTLCTNFYIYHVTTQTIRQPLHFSLSVNSPFYNRKAADLLSHQAVIKS